MIVINGTDDFLFIFKWELPNTGICPTYPSEGENFKKPVLVIYNHVQKMFNVLNPKP
jgi:hypothetical protein